MIDMFRNPEKLLQGIDVFTPIIIENAIEGAKKTGCPRVFMPLHRGAGGFMSNGQFEKFYWPSLKKVILSLIDAGLTPCPFLEGDYTDRLDYLAELPKGKVACIFTKVDIKKTKEVLGDRMCFWGNVPGDLFVTSTPDKIKQHVKTLIDTFGDNGGLIINGTIVGIPAEAKKENVLSVTEAVSEYGIY